MTHWTSLLICTGSSRYVNVGLFYLRQLFFAKFDLKVHTDQGDPSHSYINSLRIDTASLDADDYSALWANMREQVSLVKGGENPPAGQGTFGHIVGGYDAGYYGYGVSLPFPHFSEL